MLSLFLRCSFILGLFSLLGCHKSAPERSSGPVDLVARGRAVYQANCTACHNSDPKQPGSLGPDIAKSPLELIRARVMKADYPAGYTPKRKTKIMQPLPQLKDDIPALHAYLNSL